MEVARVNSRPPVPVDYSSWNVEEDLAAAVHSSEVQLCMDIRMQWVRKAAAVQMLCVLTHHPAEDDVGHTIW